MATSRKKVITSDEEALALLEKALQEQGNPNSVLQLDGWPTVSIKLKGANYDGTITAGTAQALIDYQKAVEHAYLQLVATGSKKLTLQEKRQLVVTAKVEKGSTFLTIDLNEALTQIATQLIGKMSPNDIIITVLGLGAIAGASVVAKAFAKERSERLTKDAELQGRLALSKEETKRLEVVTQAMKQQPKLTLAKEEFDDARDGVLRSSADADSVELDGVVLTGQQATTMARQPRTKSEDAQLNGVYIITGVTWPSEGEVFLDLRSVDKNGEFKASLSTESLLQRDKDLIAKAEWDRTPLYLSINAKKLRGEVVSAAVVGFDWEKLRARGIPKKR